ncbi:MAG: two-component sensor histidine kinase [Gammaproteobacteria bacterium]|nr:MAG: two-component sensor histidine kinase [Gammaproteobacteria bacterium]
MTNLVQPCPFSKNYLIPEKQAWQSLQLFHLYRLLLGFGFCLLFFTNIGPSFLGLFAPNLFGIISTLYLLLGVIQAPFIFTKSPSYNPHPFVQLFIDIIAITLLMHASGGVTSGIGMLLIVSVTAGGSLIGGRCSLLFAAIASIAILVEQGYSAIVGLSASSAFSYTGMLGMAFFAIALLAQILGSRAEQSQLIVEKQGIDLANLEQLNKYIIQQLQSGIIVVDSNRVVRMINESAKRLLQSSQLVEHCALNQISAELDSAYQDWLKQPHSQPITLKSNQQIQFNRLNNTRGAGDIIFIEDNALLAQRAQQIKLASLGRLTASIAHEIRNPLGAISHASQLLTESPSLPKSDVRLTEIINDNTIRLNGVINTILQISRRDATQKEELNLQSWLEKFAQDFQSENPLPSDTVSCQLEKQPLNANVDGGHLKQIMDNLCTNALKHGQTTPDNPSIRLRLTSDSERRNAFVDIIDPGPDIGSDAIPQLFEPFFTTSSSGTGLGLYLSKELAELNQAQLEYKKPTKPEMNGFFRLTIPLNS